MVSSWTDWRWYKKSFQTSHLHLFSQTCLQSPRQNFKWDFCDQSFSNRPQHKLMRRISVFWLFQNSGKKFGERDSVANWQPTIFRSFEKVRKLRSYGHHVTRVDAASKTFLNDPLEKFFRRKKFDAKTLVSSNEPPGLPRLWTSFVIFMSWRTCPDAQISKWWKSSPYGPIKRFIQTFHLLCICGLSVA